MYVTVELKSIFFKKLYVTELSWNFLINAAESWNRQINFDQMLYNTTLLDAMAIYAVMHFVECKF